MSLQNNAALKSLFREQVDHELLDSAYERFNDLTSPFRCNLFALQIRELLRFVVDRISPETAIQECSWFKAAQDSRSDADKGKITRRDRYRFAITGNISDEAIEDHPELDTSVATGDLARFSGQLSKFAHISSGTYALSVDKADAFRTEVESVVIAFADTLVSVREKARDLLWSQVENAVYEAVSGMELESGLMDTKVLIGNFSLLELQETHLSSCAPSLTGMAEVEIQYAMGSGSDTDYADMWKPVYFEIPIDPVTLAVLEPIVTLTTRLTDDE